MKFKWYVLNYNSNARKVEMFNIFDNWILNDAVEKEVKDYLKAPDKYTHEEYRDTTTLVGFEAFCKELEGLIMWQEWGRLEYEVSVGKPFETDIDKLEKWDCYQQCEPNIPMIAREVIWQYQNLRRKK